MSKCLIVLFLLSFPVFSKAQGVNWEENMTWLQILQKAKEKNKFIFVDCFATWCGPCKMMDKMVYTNEKVGAFMNAKFISVKIQMDQTKEDDQKTRAWYEDAKHIAKLYKVNSFPTFLFFSPQGKILHEFSAGLDVDGFIELANNALDPNRQYFTNLNNYKNGMRDTGSMRMVALSALNRGDSKIASEVATEYIDRLRLKDVYRDEVKTFIQYFRKVPKTNILARKYINGLSSKEIFTKSNISFLVSFTRSTKDRGFIFFYKYPRKINEIYFKELSLPENANLQFSENDYAQSVARSIIFFEEFYKPYIEPLKDSIQGNELSPNWEIIKLNLQQKYPLADVERISTEAQVVYYKAVKDWTNYSIALINKIDLEYHGKDLTKAYLIINNLCWELFQKCSDTVILGRAIIWMETLFLRSEAARKWATAIDTYANLLYKVGRVKEAIEWEEKAFSVNPSEPDVKENIEKMKTGTSTWPKASK